MVRQNMDTCLKMQRQISGQQGLTAGTENIVNNLQQTRTYSQD